MRADVKHEISFDRPSYIYTASVPNPMGYDKKQAVQIHIVITMVKTLHYLLIDQALNYAGHGWLNIGGAE